MAEDFSSAPSFFNFRGVVRLFPLPNFVMFPHALQPLHVFEPRYLEMVEDALRGDQLIAPVMLLPGIERSQERKPALASVACLSRILSHQRLPDGRIQLLLQGLRRAAVRRELSQQRAFREAEVDLLDDFYSSSGAPRRPKLLRQLVAHARRIMPDHEELEEQLARLSNANSLGLLTDIVSHTFPLPVMWKHRLLAEWNVDRRSVLLSDRLAAWPSPAEAALAAQESREHFPFSPN